MSRLLILFFVFASFSARARLVLNIGMIYKNGIDKNLVLESELHSVEDIWGNRKIELIMKNGTKLLLQAGFWERPKASLNEIGPSSKIFLDGRLYQPSGKLIREIKKEVSQVELGETFLMDFKDQTHIIEVTIKPYLK